MDISFILVMGIVFFAFFTQAASGFGAMIIALTLSALIYPVPLLLTWFVPLVIMLSIYLLIRHHDHIAWRLFLTRILPGMAGGMLVGQWLFYSLDLQWLKYLLGVVVIVLASRELLRKSAGEKQPPLLPWTLSAGVVHGIFASGGPLLVYALNGQKLEKGAFRSTLALVWLVLAVFLVASYLLSGALTTQALPQIGLLAAVLPFSILLGEWVHQRINEDHFKRAINVLLVFSGIVLLIK